jgi:hypothetical protein
MKQTILLLLSFCAFNSVFSQWNYVSGSSGPIYYTGGNVGIGTSSPGAALDIAGSFLARLGVNVRTDPSNPITAYLSGPTSGTQSSNVVLQANAGGGNAFWLTAANFYLKIGGSGGSETTAAAPINIDYLGNVGINTLNTGGGYKFAVNGTAIFDGVTVQVFSSNNPKATSWADYVFDKGYQLPSLQSVAAYIAANHHLDGIPTTAEVEKNGLNLGVNQTKMLEKIEQLTLYSIDLQKQADQSRTENEKLVQLLQTQSQQLASLQQQVDELKKAGH